MKTYLCVLCCKCAKAWKTYKYAAFFWAGKPNKVLRNNHQHQYGGNNQVEQFFRIWSQYIHRVALKWNYFMHVWHGQNRIANRIHGQKKISRITHPNLPKPVDRERLEIETIKFRAKLVHKFLRFGTFCDFFFDFHHKLHYEHLVQLLISS